jgi:PAS domain S-box-containing protein
MEEEHADRGGRERGDGGRYQHLIEHIQDAVVEFDLVEGEPVITSVNSAFVDVFGYEREALHGDSLNKWIVPEWRIDEARRLDDRTATGEVNYRRVTRETADGLREFLYRGVPYEKNVPRDGGFAVYTDLTEITQTERRLQVMNRVLRHNLRNKATSIVGSTTELLAEFDDQTADRTRVAAMLEASAEDLMTLTEEAADIHRVLESPETDVVVDCVPIVRDVVGEHRQRSPRARIETDLPASMNVAAGTHLKGAVDSLVDNAIEHNPNPTPRVRVSIDDAAVTGDAREEWIVLHVEDDGPRIPPDEREVILDGAEITPTHHGSGLGLWLTELTVETFGGDLAFDTSDMGGNDVSIRLRRR